jgi:hypothetical protein
VVEISIFPAQVVVGGRTHQTAPLLFGVAVEVVLLVVALLVVVAVLTQHIVVTELVQPVLLSLNIKD